MEQKKALEQLQLLACDVDGTLSDGWMYYTAGGDGMKRFYVQDGMGITLLQRAGIRVALITSENSPIVLARAKKLRIEHVIVGCQAKKQALEQLAQETGIPLDHMGYIGDDVNDEAPMRLVAFSACPSDAVPVIKSVAKYVCQAVGGRGAVREVAELILAAQHKPNTLPEVW